MHDNTAALNTIYPYACPGPFSTGINGTQLLGTQAYVGGERSLTFTAAASAMQLTINFGGNVGGTSGNQADANNVCIDDVALIRLD